ncbi:MAG: hypothetical protein LBP21_06565 [Synergistaceae bacterium]|jgi:hypothetical protein|nr:hypothetical protein [Synergistaceae bacterium]
MGKRKYLRVFLAGVLSGCFFFSGTAFAALPPGNVTVNFLMPPFASVGSPLTCSVQMSAPVENAVLSITYPDGSVHSVDLQKAESILTFTFTPPMAGTYILGFTLIESDTKLSEPTLSFEVYAEPPVPIDLSGLEGIGLSNGVLRITTGQFIDVQLSSALRGRFTSTPLPANLVLTEDGHLSGAVVVPGSYTITISVELPVYQGARHTAAADRSVTFTLVVTEKTPPAPNPSPAPQNSKSGGGCDAGAGGLIWVILLAASLSRFEPRK